MFCTLHQSGFPSEQGNSLWSYLEKDTTRRKGGKKKEKKAGVVILLIEKLDFKTKTVTRDKEGLYIIIKG